jgi:phage portal protein BeeE
MGSWSDKDLGFQDEDQVDVVVEAADGWRHGSEDVDLSDPEVQQRSYDLAKASLERVRRGKLSHGERLFLDSVEAKHRQH